MRPPGAEGIRSPWHALEIRKLHGSGQWSVEELAGMYCLSVEEVQDVVARRTWAGIETIESVLDWLTLARQAEAAE